MLVSDGWQEEKARWFTESKFHNGYEVRWTINNMIGNQDSQTVPDTTHLQIDIRSVYNHLYIMETWCI